MARKLSVYDADQIISKIEETLGVRLEPKKQDLLTNIIGWVSYGAPPLVENALDYLEEVIE